MATAAEDIGTKVRAYEDIKDTLRARVLREVTQTPEWKRADEQIRLLRVECGKLGHTRGRFHSNGLGCIWWYCSKCGVSSMWNATDFSPFRAEFLRTIIKSMELPKPMVSVQFAEWSGAYLYWAIEGLQVGDLVLAPVEVSGKPPYQVGVVTRLWFYTPQSYDPTKEYKTIYEKIQVH